MTEEWKQALDTARQFNDLLMRLRTFGIPVVITIMGTAVAFGFDIRVEVELWWVVRAIVAVAILGFVLVLWLFNRANWGRGPVGLKTMEQFMWLLVPVLTLIWGFVHGYWLLTLNVPYGATRYYPVAIIILGFSLVLLATLYILDRFYYFKLLIGAVQRARNIECEIGYKLTKTIMDHIPYEQSYTLVTLLYWVPGMSGLLLIALLILPTSQKRRRCAMWCVKVDWRETLPR